MIALRVWGLPQALVWTRPCARRSPRVRDRERASIWASVMRLGAGMLYLLPHVSGPDIAVITWRGERELALPGLGRGAGDDARRGAGLSVQRLRRGPSRSVDARGGERLKRSPIGRAER